MIGVKARVEEFEKGDKSQIPDHPQPSSQGEDVKRHTRVLTPSRCLQAVHSPA